VRPALRQGPRDVRRPGQEPQGGAAGHARARDRLVRHARQRRQASTVVKNAREAEKPRRGDEQLRLKKSTTTADAVPKEVSSSKLFANIAATQAKVLKVIVKTDVFGSAEAVRNVLEGIKSTKVSLEIVSPRSVW
jgi:translation initiation factor IF-2